MGKKISILIFILTVSVIALMAVIRIAFTSGRIIPGYPFLLDRFLAEMRPIGGAKLAEQTAGQVLEILEKRMANFGIENFSLDQKGTDKIQIDIYNPSISPSYIRKLIVQIGSVEFGLLLDKDDLHKIGGAFNRYQKSINQTALFYLHPRDDQALVLPVEFEDTLEKYLATEKAMNIIGDPMISMIRDRNIIENKNHKYLTIYLVKKYKDFNQDHITDIKAKKDFISGGQLVLVFDETGRKILADLTNIHKGERLAIIIDGQVMSSPVMRERITDGKVAVSGRTLGPNLKILEATIKSGPLKIPIEIVKEETKMEPQSLLRFF
jgi:preprotein translocase subunit SecD